MPRAGHAVRLGARLYDPVIGRFLGRDPLIVARASASTNPYSFARNDPLNSSDPSGLDGPETPPDPLPPIFPFNLFFGSGGGRSSGSPPPAPDPWDGPVTSSGPTPVVSLAITGRVLALQSLVAADVITSRQAAGIFRDFIRKEVYVNQKYRRSGQSDYTGFCACASRQMALKHADIIQLGKSYFQIKTGLRGERSAIAIKDGQWESFHFNETTKAKQFTNDQQLNPNAIAQIARNPQIGTGSTVRLRWTKLDSAAVETLSWFSVNETGGVAGLRESVRCSRPVGVRAPR